MQVFLLGLARQILGLCNVLGGHPRSHKLTALDPGGVAACRSNVEPHVRLHKVLQGSLALGVHPPQSRLCRGKAHGRCGPVSRQGLLQARPARLIPLV
ncbi:MAG: hypothetical protein EBR89_05535 [Betaproteobacteria bacterium]|nr:hypothetical protein [Betaproteobacteria bacterium]